MIQSRWDLINELIRKRNYNNYLEIGVSNPDINYNKINLPDSNKFSVDPCEDCEGYSEEDINSFKDKITHVMTSDEFFENNSYNFDIIFIDGLHLDYQLNKDIVNSLKFLNKNGIIICHDCLPSQIDFTGEKYIKGQPWYGTCWKVMHRYINDEYINQFLDIKVSSFETGLLIIELSKTMIDDDINHVCEYISGFTFDDIDYKKDYRPGTYNLFYDAQKALLQPDLSYFTSVYNIDVIALCRVYLALQRQTHSNWEWVVVNDSIQEFENDDRGINIDKFFQTTCESDHRVKYHHIYPKSVGTIGLAKHRVASLCSAKYIAELDHDDILLANCTEKLLKNINIYNPDFIFSDSASVYITDNLKHSIKNTERYPEGFGMGYGSYYEQEIQNPCDGLIYNVDVVSIKSINPKTLRHIVGVPNHIRCWKKEFYDNIGGHNTNLDHADDYELIVRTFLNKGVIVHLNECLYLQVEHEDSFTYQRRQSIQYYVKYIGQCFDYEIKKRFDELIGIDWAYHIRYDEFDPTGKNDYWFVPNITNEKFQKICDKKQIFLPCNNIEEYDYAINVYERTDYSDIKNAQENLKHNINDEFKRRI